MPIYIIIHFINGSVTVTEAFLSAADTRRYARENISYSGGTIDSVRLVCGDDHRETLWQHDWDHASKLCGVSDCL